MIILAQQAHANSTRAEDTGGRPQAVSTHRIDMYKIGRAAMAVRSPIMSVSTTSGTHRKHIQLLRDPAQDCKAKLVQRPPICHWRPGATSRHPRAGSRSSMPIPRIPYTQGGGGRSRRPRLASKDSWVQMHSVSSVFRGLPVQRPHCKGKPQHS
jgi:hypothetical protein